MIRICGHEPSNLRRRVHVIVSVLTCVCVRVYPCSAHKLTYLASTGYTDRQQALEDQDEFRSPRAASPTGHLSMQSTSLVTASVSMNLLYEIAESSDWAREQASESACALASEKERSKQIFLRAHPLRLTPLGPTLKTRSPAAHIASHSARPLCLSVLSFPHLACDAGVAGSHRHRILPCTIGA